MRDNCQPCQAQREIGILSKRRAIDNAKEYAKQNGCTDIIIGTLPLEDPNDKPVWVWECWVSGWRSKGWDNEEFLSVV